MDRRIAVVVLLLSAVLQVRQSASLSTCLCPGSSSTSASASDPASPSSSTSVSASDSVSPSTSASVSTSDLASLNTSSSVSASVSTSNSTDLVSNASGFTCLCSPLSPTLSSSSAFSTTASASPSVQVSSRISTPVSTGTSASSSTRALVSIDTSTSLTTSTSASSITSVPVFTSTSTSLTTSTSASSSTSVPVFTSTSTSLTTSTSTSLTTNTAASSSTSVPVSTVRQSASLSTCLCPGSSSTSASARSDSASPSSSTSVSASDSVSPSTSASVSTSDLASLNTSSSVSASVSTSKSTDLVSNASGFTCLCPPLSPTLSSSSMFSTTVTIEPPTTGVPTTEAPTTEAPTTAMPTNMYPYGPEQGDSEYRLSDSPYNYGGHCLKIKTDRLGFPFFGERHYKLYICRNGKIQLNYEWSWWWPQKFGVYRWFNNMAIIAPFWATTDDTLAFRLGVSKVYYQVYIQSSQNSAESKIGKVLTMASTHVQSYDRNFATFEATWVLVVTWENLCPYVYYPWYYYYYWYNRFPPLNCPGRNTFQAVIITNGINTFLMYNYPRGGIEWVGPVVPRYYYYYYYWSSFYGLPVAGYNAGDRQRNFENMKGSGTPVGMLELDERRGNTGEIGRYFWRIEKNDVRGALQKCFSWTWFQRFFNVLQRMSWVDWACPCTPWQAWFDPRFFRNWWLYSWPDWCFESRRARFLSFYSRFTGWVYYRMTLLCCYSTEWQNWASLKRGAPDGGRVKVQVYYSNYYYSTFIISDSQAYKACCVDLPFCDLFYDYRPSDDCSRYVPPRRRWFWGDPHFKTLDGGNYTFNGLGEYVMIDAQNGTFQLQARTVLAQGNSTTATIFIAGAAKEENTSIVEVKVKKGGGINILIDHSVYSGYSNLTNQSINVGSNISVSKPEENCLEVTFPSTTAVKFCEKKEMLSFVVTPGEDYKNATKGLLGTWNDNPDDDYTLPDGAVLPSSSSLRDIHFKFGVKWQINQSQSLFTYASNESVATFAKPDFEPMFADNITWHNESLKLQAEDQCGDDHECLFDAASTRDLSVGLVTKDISIQLVNESNNLENFPPKIINNSSSINATYNSTVQLNITAEDTDTITFRVINKPPGAKVNQIGNVFNFTWLVTSAQKFNLSFVATDDKGASTTWSPTINMCACDHGGQCVQPEEGDPVNTDSRFVYMGCACQEGFTGRFCESDIDACEMNGQPCYTGVKCIDLPAPANATGYECGPCPSGYSGNGAQCAELDECESNETNDCQHLCINVPGSFLCDCRDGYKLNSTDGKSCNDVNECELRNNCTQKCDNTVGSYNCSCDKYFKKDPADWTNCVAENPCDAGHGCQHFCFKGGDNQARCACRAHYELDSNGKTCKDINECDPVKPLHHCAQICENTPGSYKCSCQEGFQLNRDGYDCQDVNECLDEDSYSCTDQFHRCVNTRGSYKCECDRNLYFIDGKCREIGEGMPELPTPRNSSKAEQEQAVQISIANKDNFTWDFNTDKNFREKMASVTSSFCSENRTECALKDLRRKRRALFLDLYTADQVHRLPGYPSNASGFVFIAFYVQQPVGLFIGNVSVLPANTLLGIIILYKPQLESAIGAKISDVKVRFPPTTSPTTEPSPSTGVEASSNENWKWIVIGVCVGLAVILLIVLVAFWCVKKRKKVVITPKEEETMVMQDRRPELLPDVENN